MVSGRPSSAQTSELPRGRATEFRWLVAASAQSHLGDQLARVALTILIFERTNSPALTALVYSLTMIPELFGGLLLGPLADLLERRTLLIATDAIRAVLIGIMALPGLPVVALCVLLVLAVFLGSPYDAAQGALLFDVVDDDEYDRKSAFRSTVNQLAQLLGFGVGGIVVAATSPRATLALDAATFLVAALITGSAITNRPAARDPQSQGGVWRHGFATLFGDRQLLTLAGLAWLVGFYVVPEGIAEPLNRATADTSWSVGVLLAALPLGTAVGTFGFSRLSAPLRQRFLPALVLLAPLPMVLCFAQPGYALLVALLVLTGAGSGYFIQVQIEFMRAVPDSARGQTGAIVSTGLIAAQGIGLLLGGVLAEHASAQSTVAYAGLAAVIVGAILVLCRQRLSRSNTD